MVAKHRNGIANDENLCPDGAFKRFRAKHTKRRKKSKKKKKEEKGETNVFKRNPLGCGQHENFICFRIPADQSILNEQNHSG